MRHGSATPTPRLPPTLEGRLARLSLEYIDATPERQKQINAEFDALLSGKAISFQDRST